MLTVLAEYLARAGSGDEVAAVLLRHAEASRCEAGCVAFRAYRDPASPERFALFEQYVDEAAFAAHRRTTHFRDNIERTVAPLLLERTWRRYEELVAQ